MVSALTQQAPAATEDIQPLCHIVTPVGCLGYGLDADITEEELIRLSTSPAPTAIILDSGSTDSGPARLALGKLGSPRSSYVRDLKKLLRLVHRYHVPLIFSSAGGDGSDEHVDEMVDVVQELVEGDGGGNRKTKVVAVHASISKPVIKKRLAEGKVKGCSFPVPPLTEVDVEDAPRIVAQMGAEAFLDVMRAEPDFNVIVGGRAYDPSPYVAYAAYHALGASTSRAPLHSLESGILGGFFHMGKIIECGAQCATPKTSPARSTIYADGSFDIIPLDPNAKCIPRSVAAHTMYEKSRPDLLLGPGGTLDLTKSTYEQLSDGRTVRARGSLFHSQLVGGSPYTVKLEAGRIRGYRTLAMGAFRDPVLTGQIDSFLSRVRDYVTYQHREYSEWWELDLHKFGAYNNGAPGEVWIVCEAIAQTQQLATSVASTARVACVHGPYPGQKATSGNFAFGMGGLSEIEMGPQPEFCVYHVMDLEAGEEGAIEKPEHGATPGRLFTYRKVTFGSQGLDDFTNLNGFAPDAESSNQNGTSKPKPKYSVTAGYVSVEDFQLPAQIRTLGDITPVLRSKNAGPYEITLDVMFPSEVVYRTVKDSGLLNADLIASLYSLKVEDVIYSGFFDQAIAFKATIPRMRNGKYAISGSFGEEDVHGSQMYLPLMNLELSAQLIEKLQATRAL
ncbi:hypothetical protein BDV96DRAFT_653739 [Lophiotrema nucula]|uniref:Caib baif family enzyme n=1 Tax=Lophiotrema nucula TaxID=690887 RepID=A0A6A5YK94_9PLEO|nr:hypothetical protein BDV96DRAFT_653739 [Lophiotrema nucula]